jgi:hypothetical protein
MATFTLTADINELTGGDASRVTVVRVRVSHQIHSGAVVYPLETLVSVLDGVFSVSLPADAEPPGYVFDVIADQIGTSWTVSPGDAGATVDLGQYVPYNPGAEGIVVLVGVGASVVDNGDGTGTITT